MKYTDDDPRLARAIELKRQHPSWTIDRIAAAAGIGRDRCRDTLAEAGFTLRKGNPPEPMAAPPWYEAPCGRVQALRRAHGIDTHG